MAPKRRLLDSEVTQKKEPEKKEFNSPQELVDYDTFFPAGTNSALSRNLTKNVWEQYKD